MSYEDNKWELYSSILGWQEASAALDAAAIAAYSQADSEVAAGATHVRAALNALNTLWTTMRQYKEFGAMDSEPLRRSEWLMERHFKKTYHVELNL